MRIPEVKVSVENLHNKNQFVIEFKTLNGDVIFTSQPYADRDYVLEEFNKYFTEDFELSIFDTKESWYYPGQTILFVIRLKTKQKS